VLDGVGQQLLLGSITLETNSQETVLLAPISEVVHRCGVETVGVQNVADKGSDNGGTQVTGVEGLGNVGRRELDNDLLSCSSVVATPTSLGLIDALEQGLSQLDVVQEKVDKGTIGLGQDNIVANGELSESKSQFLKQLE